LALTSPTGCGRSVGIVRLRTKTTEFFFIVSLNGRAIAQAVSRQLSTATASIRSHFKSCGICGGQSGTAAGFLRVLLFSLPSLIPTTAPHSSSSIFRDWCKSQLVADVPSGLGVTPPQETKKTILSCKSDICIYEFDTIAFTLSP
jgi:hypothetical protein